MIDAKHFVHKAFQEQQNEQQQQQNKQQMQHKEPNGADFLFNIGCCWGGVIGLLFCLVMSPDYIS